MFKDFSGGEPLLAYGFETNSGNMPWLRAKVIAAIDDAAPAAVGDDDM